jgi:hypothetical protein
VSIRGQCPKCDAPLGKDELRVNPTVCPRCKTELQVLIRANWVYTVASFTIGVLVAYFQGLESIILGMLALVYGTVILASIKFYRWELHLPIKIAEKNNYRLFPTDTS